MSEGYARLDLPADGAEISVVVPALNERQALPGLVDELERAPPASRCTT